jgi:D-inositol-3-phosphate glycosyltransferase
MDHNATLAVLGPLGTGFEDTTDITEVNIEAVNGYLCDVMETIAERNLDEQVHLIGFVDENKLPAYYDAADAVVFPSVLESFGMIPIEAAACGTPTVAHNVAPMTEIIQDDETGRIVPISASALADGLDDVLDSTTNERLGSAARQVATEEFSLSARADDHLQIYEHLSEASHYQKN